MKIISKYSPLEIELMCEERGLDTKYKKLKQSAKFSKTRPDFTLFTHGLSLCAVRLFLYLFLTASFKMMNGIYIMPINRKEAYRHADILPQNYIKHINELCSKNKIIILQQDSMVYATGVMVIVPTVFEVSEIQTIIDLINEYSAVKFELSVEEMRQKYWNEIENAINS